MHRRDFNLSYDLHRSCRYFYYAGLARAEEDATKAQEPKAGLKEHLFPSKNNKSLVDEKYLPRETTNEKGGMESPDLMHVSDAEWINAQRAIRTASGAAAFYLITTDILGPFGLPYSFGTIGWV